MAAPIYLYTGPEIGSRNEQVDSVKNSLVKKFGEVDNFLLYASDSKIEDIIAKLQTESLFVPATCVVLREAELVKKKDEIELISSWLKGAKDSSVLILVSDEISVDSKLDKLVPKENKQIFWAMDESRLSSWLQGYFRKNGYSVEPEALDSILELTEQHRGSSYRVQPIFPVFSKRSCNHRVRCRANPCAQPRGICILAFRFNGNTIGVTEQPSRGGTFHSSKNLAHKKQQSCHDSRGACFLFPTSRTLAFNSRRRGISRRLCAQDKRLCKQDCTKSIFKGFESLVFRTVCGNPCFNSKR